MLVRTEIIPQVYDVIMDLVKRGKYATMESFVDIAIRNQITLERSTVQERNREVHEGKPSLSTYDQLRKNKEQNLLTVPAISLDSKRRSTPIWGLINRYEPSKVVLRLLVNTLVQSKTQWTEFKQFTDDAVSIGSQIRNQIEKFERRSDVIRGQSLKIGFPKKDPKSQQRFVDLFIGKLRNESYLSGLLGDLQLAVIKKSQQGSQNNTVIGITEAGLEWANMDSPFIDEFISGPKAIQSPLSNEEIDFLLSRIREIKPGDYEFLSYVFKLVKEGVNTPDKLSEHVALYLESLKLNSAMFSTFQTGGVARLVEMRIIQLDKSGTHTRYSITSSGKTLEELHQSMSKKFRKTGNSIATSI